MLLVRDNEDVCLQAMYHAVKNGDIDLLDDLLDLPYANIRMEWVSTCEG